jgi:hypothetical protein
MYMYMYMHMYMYMYMYIVESLTLRLTPLVYKILFFSPCRSECGRKAHASSELHASIILFCL